MLGSRASIRQTRRSSPVSPWCCTATTCRASIRASKSAVVRPTVCSSPRKCSWWAIRWPSSWQSPRTSPTQPGAPKQWDNSLDGTIVGVTKPFQRGDPGAAMASSDVKVDHVAVKPVEQHVALELTNSLTWWENERLNMIYTSQGAHSVRAALASALRLPLDKVHVIQQGYMGSGYGYRGSIDIPEI